MPGGQPLLERVMAAGRRLSAPPTLADLRARATAELARLPPHLRRLEETPPYPVAIGADVQALAAGC